jgi:transaldolase
VTKLHRLFDEQGQSPWLDNLTREYLRDGTLSRFISQGIRGITTNPTIMAKSIESSDVYDEQIAALTAGVTPSDVYWALVSADVCDALSALRPIFDASGGNDGFVSIEVAPDLAHDTARTISAALTLHARIQQPNLLVKIPATAAGIPAIRELTKQGISVNVTLIFSLSRYREVVDAYQSGLASYASDGGDVSNVRSVASFFVSRIDSEVDRRLENIGTPAALTLRGRSALAQASMAYALFADRFSSASWNELAVLGANPQRPLWASTSTKNPDYPDTLYVNGLIGPETINTLPESTIAAFEDHGEVARTVDCDVEGAREVLTSLARVGIDMELVGTELVVRQ